MSQPNFPKVTLAQCTGVTPAPVCQPANLSQREANEQKFTSVHAAQIDSRQPLHDNNSQTSPCSNNSHKRSRTTSDSIVITPSDKRQTVLALSPEKPLPAGQQWTTLEVQRVLSLTPGLLLQQHRLPLTSTEPQVGTEETASQESLEGTQAEADALIEESSYWVINTNDDEGHEERAWGALILHISQSTFAEVAAALGQPFSSWAKTKSFSAVDRLLWAARIHVDRVNFSFEGGLDTIPLSTETDWVEGEMCSPSEAAERLATFEAEGHITFAHHPPFSCSAAGSSAPGFELTQGTQFGTVIEEAAAIIKYSQMHAAHPPVPRLSPVPVVESQLQRHASQGMLSLASQQAVGRCSVTVALAGPAQPEAQPTSQAATQLPSDLPAVASQDDAIAAPCGRGQQASCAGKAQPVAVQVSSHHATPLPEGPAASQPEETGPSPAGGVWCALADLDAAAEGTEVTPSGLRPPRGPSSTPLIQPAASDGSPHASSPISAGRHPTSKPHGRSTQQELIIADSEEPLVLHRQHGPAKRAFLDAHALPCSSPNSPPDPLCSYVPATADIASPMKGAQKKGGSPKAKPGKVGEVAAGGLGRVPKLADDEALPDGAPVHGKQAKHAARPGKGKSKRKTKAAPQMGPPGARYRAGLPAPRYQSHHPKPCTTPPLAANRLQPHIQIPAQKDAAAHQQQSLLVAESAGKDAAALHAWHGPGLGAGLRGAGLSARNAVAALCSARRQTAEPRNAYSFPDSLSPPAEADGAEPHCSSPTGINGTGPAQQAKHGQHRASAVAKVHLPDATARLQASCLAEDRTISAPPQQSRRAWQLKASAQAIRAKQQEAAAKRLSKQHSIAAEASAKLAARKALGIGQAQLSAAQGKAGARAGRKRGRDTGSIALDKPARKRQPPPRHDDMVGHSQLDSDMLQASPQAPADQGNVADDAAAVKRDFVDCEEEGPVDAEASNEEGVEVFAAGSAADEALAMPEPGCKRKRSKLQHSRMREALLDEAADPDSEPAAAATPVIPVKPAGQLKVRLPPLGCSKCRWSAKGCKKCRHDREAALQAVGGADAEAGIPAEQPAGDVRKAVASPGSNQASPCINQHAQAPHHASSVPAEPATNGQGRRRTRRSAGPELLGQTRGNASVSPTPAEPSHGQDRKAGQGRADQQDRQGRAAPSSPALSSPGGSRAMHRHRRSSLGGGGVLPFGGHSFLLTAYSDERQKERICHKITQLGGHVLEDIPKPQGSRRASLAGNASHPVLALFAGSPAWEPSFGRLIQHAGGHLVSGVGDSTSPGGVHHAIQAPCDCILSDFPDGSDELQQVHRLARRLRVPVKGKAWAIIGFKDGKLPALPSPSPTKPSKLPPSSPPLPSAITAGGAGQLLTGDIQWVGPSIEPPTGLDLTPSQHQTFYAAFARGGVVVEVGDFVELSPVPGEDLTRLVQVAALWSEPTQARQRMLASCHRFYRASETCIQYGFPPHEVFSSQDIEAKVPLLAVLCKCSIVYGRNGPTGNHNYLCPFAYDYASNSLRGH
ncbi:hypothetical protein WJX79_000270 [Trebouxia sp. C0005]